MTIKEVKEKYKFHHIFINGNEIYHKDSSLDNREVKSIKEKDYFFNSKAVYVTIWNNYFIGGFENGRNSRKEIERL